MGGKYKYWNSAEPGTYIMCPYKISVNIWNTLKALAWKMTYSHNQPLRAYLMRYDAHIQSHLRSSPKWYIYWKKLKYDEKNSSYHPDTDGGRTDGRTNRVNPVLVSNICHDETLNKQWLKSYHVVDEDDPMKDKYEAVSHLFIPYQLFRDMHNYTPGNEVEGGGILICRPFNL